MNNQPVGRDRLIVLFVVSLLLATASYVAGVAVERNLHESTPRTTADAHTEGGEVGGIEPGESGEDTSQEGAHAEVAQGDEPLLLGVDVESTPVVAIAVLLALLLAGAVWWRPTLLILALGLIFCLGATVLDVRELVHQLDENRNSVATLAGLVALLHLVAATAAAMALRQRSQGSDGAPLP